ncbi:MAG TPA: DUF1385 domain-containing protein [Anaerolineae bacterium]|nr:DUF1385 domain-containing protein [Anaerolineae bacterium]
MGNFYYGGQAVLEGVMMRGQRRMAIAVRAPDGQVVIHEEPLTARIYTRSWGKWPFIRGLSLLWDALGLGMRALMWSADVALSEEEDVEFKGPVAWTTVAVSLAIGIGIFFLLPSAAAQFLERFSITSAPLVSAFVEGGIRLLLFLAYLYLIGLMPDIRRVFAYHGAEHKTINAYEAGASLTPESVACFSTRHTRCGTSFLLFVLVVSIFLFAPFQFDHWYLRLLSRILLIPVVAGVSYELIRFGADHQEVPGVRWLVAPGLALQGLTTREPDLDMLEVGIAALKPVLAADGIVPLAAQPGGEATGRGEELPATA